MKKIATSLFQMGPVITGMFSVTLYLIIESAFLLYSSIPDYIGSPFWRAVAASFIAFGLHLTVLTTAVNNKIIGNRIFPAIFAILATLITCFFFGVFQEWNLYSAEFYKDALFSMFIGLSNYVYVYLFVAKHEESEMNRPLTERIAELDEALTKSNKVLTMKEKALTTLRQQLDDAQRQANEALTSSNEALAMRDEALTVLHQQQDEWEKNLTAMQEKRFCPHCQKIVKNRNALSRHMALCPEKNDNHRIPGDGKNGHMVASKQQGVQI